MGRKPKEQKVEEEKSIFVTPEEAVEEVVENNNEFEVAENSPEIPLNSEEAEAEEEFGKCEGETHEPAWFSEIEVFIQRLKEILNNCQGLDFEPVNLKKQIFDLIDTFENK